MRSALTVTNSSATNGGGTGSMKISLLRLSSKILVALLTKAHARAAFSSVRHARVAGSRSSLSFKSPDGTTFSFRLRHDQQVFGSAASIEVLSGGARRAVVPPSHPLYYGRAANGAWVRAALPSAGAAALDASVWWRGGLYTVTSVDAAADADGWRAVHVQKHAPEEAEVSWTGLGSRRRALRRPLGLHVQVSPHHRRRAQLVTEAKPWGRLQGCDHVLQTLTLGLVLDHGFVAVRGGADAALLAAASAVSRSNAIFEDQLGVRLVIESVVLNEAAGGEYSQTGPNDAPANGTGTRSCPTYQQRTISGHGVTVSVGGADLALSAMSQWAGAHAPKRVGLWHLLTDCFPRPGTVGIAWQGSMCSGESAVITYGDTSAPPDPGSDGCDGAVVESNGNCASVLTSSVASNCTDADRYACRFSAGLSSNSAKLWLTVGHEIGHNLGGAHTFAQGGLMAYSDEQRLYDNGDICPAVSNQIAAAAAACFAPAPPHGTTCGDGELDADEECDDGNPDDGDGCDAACVVECGWSCAEALHADGLGLRPSVCAPSCGNGVVEPELGEECDPGDAGLGCCTAPSATEAGCRLAPNATCCGGECCDEAGQQRPTSTLCAGSASHCAAGACVTTGACDLFSNLRLDAAQCPVDADAPCRPRCARDGGGCYTFGAGDLLGAFADGAACEDAAGARGACFAGACVVPGALGDGAVGADEECDDESACCVAGRLAPGAACSGPCCPDCTPVPTDYSAGACAAAGGFCYDGACVTNASAIYLQPRTITFTSGGSSEMRLDLDGCPLSGGGCALSLRLDLDGSCYNGGGSGRYVLRDGTRCGGGGGAAAGGHCASGVCIESAVCGDGVRQPSEECDDALDTACSGCVRAVGCAADGACDPDSPCCDAATCAPAAASVACTTAGGGPGFCLHGACADQVSANQALAGDASLLGWVVQGETVVFDPSVCPVEKCTVRLGYTPFGPGDCWSGGGDDFTLEDGVPCETAAAVAGLCSGGACIVAGASCGNGIVEAGEECDDASACCDLTACTLAAGAQCSGGDCCDAGCRARGTDTVCASGFGVCVAMGRCLRVETAEELGVSLARSSADRSFHPARCPLRDGCEVEWRDLSFDPAVSTTPECGGLNPPVAAPSRSRCVASTGTAGFCSGVSCVALSTCGNGVIEPGEACDDISACCTGCQLTQGAQCSGECCDDKCRARPATVACGASGEGVCQLGECVTEALACGKVLLALNASACPVRPSQPCLLRCYDGSGTNFAERCLAFQIGFELYGGIDNFLPDGSACLPYSDPDFAGVCVAGDCVPVSACAAIDSIPPFPPPFEPPSAPPAPPPPSPPPSPPPPSPPPAPPASPPPSTPPPYTPPSPPPPSPSPPPPAPAPPPPLPPPSPPPPAPAPPPSPPPAPPGSAPPPAPPPPLEVADNVTEVALKRRVWWFWTIDGAEIDAPSLDELLEVERWTGCEETDAKMQPLSAVGAVAYLVAGAAQLLPRGAFVRLCPAGLAIRYTSPRAKTAGDVVGGVLLLLMGCAAVLYHALGMGLLRLALVALFGLTLCWLLAEWLRRVAQLALLVALVGPVLLPLGQFALMRFVYASLDPPAGLLDELGENGWAELLRWAWPLVCVLAIALAHAGVAPRRRLLPLLGWLLLLFAALCFAADAGKCEDIEEALGSRAGSVFAAHILGALALWLLAVSLRGQQYEAPRQEAPTLTEGSLARDARLRSSITAPAGAAGQRNSQRSSTRLPDSYQQQSPADSAFDSWHNGGTSTNGAAKIYSSKDHAGVVLEGPDGLRRVRL